jgi:hypothetical protein
MDFPQYRKYKNAKSYFKIDSAEEFEEYQLQFGKLVKHKFKANILPDRNYIADMLYNYHEHWEKIQQADFELFIEENASNSAL